MQLLFECNMSTDARAQAEEILTRRWGFSSFRPGQWEVIEAILAGRDALAVLPTGGGKSLCYQLPTMVQEGFTIVVSPLIALMQDQVEALNARGIPAAFINSTLRHYEIDRRWTNAEFGQYRFLYVAPERLETDIFLARAERLPVTLMAVDEAHCISEWGHHFRPSYLRLAEARERLGGPPVLAVTATATPEVRKDIVSQLILAEPSVTVKGFDRPNITWSVFHEENKLAKVLEVCAGVPGSGLLYAATRRQSESWAKRLTREGISAGAYHAGLPAERREEVQRLWMEGGLRIVTATNAFGMGIDKPDVRFVIHAALTGSVEAYYQEAGRAGRDGAAAHAVLLVQSDDETTQRTLIEESHPDVRTVREIYDAICDLAQLPIGSAPEVPLVVDRMDIVSRTGQSVGTVTMAIELLERQELLQHSDVRRGRALVRFLQPAAQVRDYTSRLSNAGLKKFVLELQRAMPGEAFEQWWEVDLRRLARRMGLSKARLRRGFAFLKERELLDWHGSAGAMQLRFEGPRVRRPAIDHAAVRKAARRAGRRLRYIIRYTQITTCRRQFLLSYFGEISGDSCGACDVCLGRHKQAVVTPADEELLVQILERVRGGATQDEWFDAPQPPNRLEALTDWLMSEDYLRVDAPLEGKFVLTEKGRNWAG